MTEQATEQFRFYSSQFALDDARIALKVEHMVKVAELTLALASDLQLDKRMTSLAYTTGLFHDIGRFRQIRDYCTFSDAASVDHAELGCKVIEEDGLLGFLDESDRKMILTAIENHNKFAIDDGVTGEDELVLCKLIRDADKIDIFRVFATQDPRDITGVGIDTIDSSEISDDLFDCLVEGRCVPNALRKTPLDKLVSSLGFIYDIAFDRSFEIILEQGFYRKNLERIKPIDDKTAARLTKLLSESESFMNERCCSSKRRCN